VSSFFLYGLVELLKKYIYIESESKIISGLKKKKIERGIINQSEQVLVSHNR
jgi:hypothetical protein